MVGPFDERLLTGSTCRVDPRDFHQICAPAGTGSPLTLAINVSQRAKSEKIIRIARGIEDKAALGFVIRLRLRGRSIVGA